MGVKDAKRRRLLMFIVPILLGTALVATAIWGVTRSAEAKEYKNATESMYRRAFEDLTHELYELSNTLSKLMITGSRTQYIKTLDDVWHSSGSCVSLMGQIPASHVDAVELNQFVVRLGDYAHALSSKLLNGEMPTEDDSKQLLSLRDKCIELSEELSTRLDSGDVPVALLDNDGYFTSSEADDSSGDEDSRQEFPTLIYDGPYSESAEKAEPRGLTGNDIDRDRALEIAQYTAGDGAIIEYAGESNGDIAAYEFSGELSDGRFVEVSITKKGGHVLYFMSQSTTDESGVPDDESVEALKDCAADYLLSAGYEGMEPTYAQYYGGVAVINFAATQDGAILYSDLIKVWVDRGEKEVIGVDARNYLFSHVKRDIGEPILTQEEAQAYISDNLDIESVSLALIPITPETERLCYEFYGRFSDELYIVYINAENGNEEQIFKVIDSDEGTSVI